MDVELMASVRGCSVEGGGREGKQSRKNLLPLW